MGSTDNFCLRWTEFESNISSSFQELRQESEFFDVTLCCDNGSDLVQAHKVILAACSPFFRQILSHNSHKNPFLYLKGIKQRELLNILQFMYKGEVNVPQECLNDFLAVAEDLSVKGLSNGENSGQQHLPTQIEESINQDVRTKRKSIIGHRKISGSKRKSGPDTSKRLATIDVEDSSESSNYDLKRIKSEPEVEISLGLDVSFDDNNKDVDYNFEPFGDSDVGPDFEDVAGTSEGDPPTDSKEMVEARFSRTQLGNALLVDPDGFCYCINRKREKRIYWVCHQQRRYKCRGSAITEGFFIIKRGGANGHTHSPYPLPQNKYNKDL